MIKWLIILLITIPIVAAGIDLTIKPALEGDMIASIINPTAVNGSSIDRGFLFRPLTIGVSIARGGIDTRFVGLYYDILVSLNKDRYAVDEIVYAEIIIINKGRFPDQDGTLVSYIQDPKGKRWRESNQTFELIAPTCPRGEYIAPDKCRYFNGTEYEPTIWVGLRNITLPMNASLGEWEFSAEYDTPIQPLIKSSVPFEVYVPRRNLFLIFLIITYFTLRYRRVTKKEKKGGREQW